MRDDERNIQTLMDLGVNRTQARIYLALIHKGTSTIRAVADYSGVGRPDTYRAMLELKHEGLIETILSTPTKYKPLPLTEVVSFLLKRKQREISSLMEQSTKLLQEYKNVRKSEVTNYDSQFVLVPEGITSIKKGISATKHANECIEFIASFKRVNQILVAASGDISDAARRGVKVRMIIDQTSINGPLSKILSSLGPISLSKIKYMPHLTHSFIAIYDKKEVQMATATEGDFIEAPILWSNNPALVKVMQNYFESMWFSPSSIWGAYEEETQIQ